MARFRVIPLITDFLKQALHRSGSTQKQPPGQARRFVHPQRRQRGPVYFLFLAMPPPG